jgi:dephospho-CoA kinase
MFIVDGALIYESGYDQHLDYVIVITALMKNRMVRALSRRTLSRQEILQRIDLQWSEEEKTGLADFVIHNDSTEENLRKKITNIYEQIV